MADARGQETLQPHPLTSFMQMIITFSALCVAGAAIIFAVFTWSEKRNAELVRIGIEVLRVDPEKEKQVAAARTWALDLIDENAGGVKFTPEARRELLGRPLQTISAPGGMSRATNVLGGNTGGGFGDSTGVEPAGEGAN